MARLLSTWNAVFPQTTLGAIARGLPPGAAGSSSGAFRTGAGPPPRRRWRAHERRRGRVAARVHGAGGRQRAVQVHRRREGGAAGGRRRRRLQRLSPRRRAPAPVDAARRGAADALDPDPRADRGLRPERRATRRRGARGGVRRLPHQCATTGVRFKTRAELDKHLDARRRGSGWHGRAHESRGGSWTLRLGSGAPPRAGLQTLLDAGAAGAAARELWKTSAPADETQKACALSGEPFETFWNAEVALPRRGGVDARCRVRAGGALALAAPCRRRRILETILETSSKRTKNC